MNINLDNIYTNLSSDNSRRKAEKIRSVIWKIVRTVLLLGIGYIILYPILYMVSMSFRDVADLYDPTVVWIPKHLTLENFKRVMDGMPYFFCLFNTVILSLGCSLLLLPACSMLAYSLARFKYKGQNIIFAGVLLTIIVPIEFFALASFTNFADFDVFGILKLVSLAGGKHTSVNITDNFLTFFLPSIFGIGIRSGLYIYILRQSFKGLPKELEEAAYIDGCGFIQTFIRIIIPSAVPAFVTVFLFSFVWHWNDYQLSSIYMPQNRTLSAALVNLSSLINESIGTIVAQTVDPKQSVLDSKVGSLLVIAPVVILYMALQRFFTESIERTGLVE